VWKGLEIIEGLRGHVSGLGVPTYVVDGLHGGKQDTADAELPGFSQRQRGDLAQL
jgi:L-lysine 2,3-aminomutase